MRQSWRTDSGLAIPLLRTSQRLHGLERLLRAGAGPDEAVGVIREEGPGVDSEGLRLGQGREAPDEVPPVGVVAKDRPPFDPAHHDVVEDARGIEARLAGHKW